MYRELLLLLLIHTFSVLSLRLKKLRRHNKSAIDLSNANPACGHKEVRRSTGHIIVTTRYSDQQGSKSRQKVMRLYKQSTPTNIKTVHQTSLLHIESNLDRLGMLSPTHDQRSQQKNGKLTLQPVLINKSKFLNATHCTEIRKNENTEVHGGGGLELVKPAREPASSRPKPCASLKKPHESYPFAAPCGRGQTSAFPSETSRFKPVILAHRGSVLPWLVNDRAALRLRRIWCVPTQ